MKAGDVVMLVWGCCAGNRRYIGEVGTLRRTTVENLQCVHCKSWFGRRVIAEVETPHPVNALVPLSWLRPIKGGDEREDTDVPREVEHA